MNKTTPEWQHRPYLLNEEDLANPTIPFLGFLQNRDLPGHREALWSILRTILATIKEDYATAEEISEWVIYFRDLEMFIESSYELNRLELVKTPEGVRPSYLRVL